MKLVLSIVGMVVLVWVGFALFASDESTSSQQQAVSDSTPAEEMAEGERAVVSDGEYVVVPAESRVNWAGKKPLIDGYVNSGSIAVTAGSITVEDETASGEFTIDMDTLSVSKTPTKPGSENALEGHLKGERWFDVGAFPQAGFTITDVSPRADSDTTFTYDITGDLTMKGQTHELSFPATIYQTENNQIIAEAETEFDRTRWGITANSGSFFDSLADNVIDDMVALSFRLVAEQE